MMNLRELIAGISFHESIGNLDLSVSSIDFDSRKVEEGFCFIAIRGTKTDGHNYISQAIDNGAKVIVCEKIPDQINEWVTYIRVENSGETMGNIACNFFDQPSSKLKLIGVTGTNGKTTTATLIYRVLRKIGFRVGLISTIGIYVNDEFEETTHTTPDTIRINRLLNQMVETGCKVAIMEVSSHAICQERIAGLAFQTGIFTNLTHDHLDYHGTFKDYLDTKKKFFDNLDSDAFALYNADDPNGKVMVQNCRATKKSFGLKTMADYKCRIIESHFDGMQLKVDDNDLWTRFTGYFNAYNLMAVYAACSLLGVNKPSILQVLSDLPTVPGRFETLQSVNGIIAIVDYAHTPDALMNVLKSINQIRDGKQNLITVVGAGGDRDKSKRPVMADVAAKSSDRLILTSDNPRSENPGEIIEDMLRGMEKDLKKKTISILDRKEAIRTAFFLARRGDIILVAGKGHETYQEIKGVKYPFDDREIINDLFRLQK